MMKVTEELRRSVQFYPYDLLSDGPPSWMAEALAQLGVDGVNLAIGSNALYHYKDKPDQQKTILENLRRTVTRNSPHRYLGITETERLNGRLQGPLFHSFGLYWVP
jgi:hypothetical protein